MTEKIYYQRNRDVILNTAKHYYENDKERLREHARDKYRNLSEEEKNKKREYGKNRYSNMSEEKKQRLNFDLIVYAVNLVIQIKINKIVFSC